MYIYKRTLAPMKMWIITYVQTYSLFLVTGMTLPVSTPTLPCPTGCTTCETLLKTSYVLRAVCSGVPPSALPTSVRELRVKNVVFPGVLTPDSFENKTDLTLLEMTNSTGCSIIWDKAFSVCSKLNNLIIENTDLLQVGEKSFWGLVALETLSLKHNKLMAINQAFIHLKNLTHLDLDFNELHEVTGDMFTGLTKLQMLRLHGNFISHMDADAFSDLLNLNTLVLAKNQITLIDSGLFQGLSNLRKLDMKENKISKIAPGAFTGTQLDQLDLEANNLLDFPAECFVNLTHTPKQISLARNGIAKLDDFMFQGLTCKYLDLSHNKISSIGNKTFEGSRFAILLLDHNQIKTMPPEILPFWIKARTVTIGDNPWHCDCDLLWMVEFIVGSSPRKYKTHVSSPMPSCAGAAKYTNKPFNKAEPDLQKDCVTTTTTSVATTTEMVTTTPKTSTELTSTMSTEMTTVIITSKTTSMTRPTTTPSSTQRTTTTTTPIKTTPSTTTTEMTTTTTTTTRTSPPPSTTEISTPETVPSKPNGLFPALWIGLAVSAALLVGGFTLWMMFGRDRKRSRDKENKVRPDCRDRDEKDKIPPMVAPTMIQVQAPASTSMPTFSSPKKKILDVSSPNNDNPSLDLHNSRTLQTTSLA